MDLTSLVVNDIESTFASEMEKRLEFLIAWRKIKGSDATYKRLIDALLMIGCREDAEGIHKLLTS